jgi:hypothetical protein
MLLRLLCFFCLLQVGATGFYPGFRLVTVPNTVGKVVNISSNGIPVLVNGRIIDATTDSQIKQIGLRDVISKFAVRYLSNKLSRPKEQRGIFITKEGNNIRLNPGNLLVQVDNPASADEVINYIRVELSTYGAGKDVKVQ